MEAWALMSVKGLSSQGFLENGLTGGAGCAAAGGSETGAGT